MEFFSIDPLGPEVVVPDRVSSMVKKNCFIIFQNLKLF